MLGSFLFWLARRLAEPPAVGPPPYAASLLPEQLHLDEVYREVKYTYDLQLRRIGQRDVAHHLDGDHRRLPLPADTAAGTERKPASGSAARPA